MESESGAEDDALAALDAFRAELGARQAGVGLTGTRAGSWVGQGMSEMVLPTPATTTTGPSPPPGAAASAGASEQRWSRGEIGAVGWCWG